MGHGWRSTASSNRSLRWWLLSVISLCRSHILVQNSIKRSSSVGIDSWTESIPQLLLTTLEYCRIRSHAVDVRLSRTWICRKPVSPGGWPSQQGGSLNSARFVLVVRLLGSISRRLSSQHSLGGREAIEASSLRVSGLTPAFGADSPSRCWKEKKRKELKKGNEKTSETEERTDETTVAQATAERVMWCVWSGFGARAAGRPSTEDQKMCKGLVI